MNEPPSDDSAPAWCPPPSLDNPIDTTLLNALSFSKDRAIVLSLEQIVLAYLRDGESQCVFPCMSETRRALKKRYGITINASYSRMLAHKVAQYYRLKTMTPMIGDRKDPNSTKVFATWADDCPKGDPYRQSLQLLSEIPVDIKEEGNEDNRSSRQNSVCSSVVSAGSRRNSYARYPTALSIQAAHMLSMEIAEGNASNPIARVEVEVSPLKSTSSLPNLPAPPPSSHAPQNAIHHNRPRSPQSAHPPPLHEQDSSRTLGSEYSYNSVTSYSSRPQAPAYPMAPPGGMQIIGYMAVPPPSPSHTMVAWPQAPMMYHPPSPQSFYCSQLSSQLQQRDYEAQIISIDNERERERSSPVTSGTPRHPQGGIINHHHQTTAADKPVSDKPAQDSLYAPRHSRLSTSSASGKGPQTASRTLTSLLDHMHVSSPLLGRASEPQSQLHEIASPTSDCSPDGPSSDGGAQFRRQEAMGPFSSLPQKDIADFPLPISLLFCPLSGQLFTDPVLVTTSGHTYERSFLIDCMVHGRGTDPKTGADFFSRDIIPNLLARQIVEAFEKWNRGC